MLVNLYLQKKLCYNENRWRVNDMKVLLYAEGLKVIGVSGLGKAIQHQMKALELEKIPYTTDPKDTYDIAHINTYFFKSYFLARKLKKKGIKIVYHAHSTEEDYRDGFIFGHLTSKIFKWWIVKCYCYGDIIVTPTEYSKNILEHYKGLEDKKIVAISNGLELDFFKPDKSYRESFRKRYGYEKDDKVIVGIGIYSRRKGIVDFVELAKRLKDYKFIWFGSSPIAAATNDVKKALKEAKELPNIQFPGHVPQERIREALGGGDLYVFPTLEETEGIPIIEACSMETDSIVRDIPIFENWLEDNVDVYKAKDIDEFEVKIKDYFAGKLPPLKNEAKRKIAQEKDVKTVGKQLKEVYEEVLGEKKE